MLNEWTKPSSIRQLEIDEIQIWRLALSEAAKSLNECRHLLNAEELARADRRLPGKVRNEFLCARACLRVLLARNLGIAAPDIPLEVNVFGKPYVVSNSAVEFNVSHSDETILIAMSGQGLVGIDVEHVRHSVDTAELASLVFSAREMERFHRLETAEERTAFFYRTWTCKEAVIKADGRGLSIPLTEFEIPLDSSEQIVLEAGSKSYFLNDIALGRDVFAAVAGESHNCRITLQDFPVTAFKDIPVKD